MSNLSTFVAQKRETTGKGAARRLRVAGNVPAIFYGTGGENIPLTVNEKTFRKHYESVGKTGVFKLEVEGDGEKKEFNCLVWKVIYHPYKKQITHIDFFGVDLDKSLKIRVPLVISGTSKGVKLGGRLEVYREQITILAKPLALPSQIDIDITNLEINQGIQVADLVLPEGVTAYYDTNFAILSILPPRSAYADTSDAEK